MATGWAARLPVFEQQRRTAARLLHHTISDLAQLQFHAHGV
jgi:hypothetical protein